MANEKPTWRPIEPRREDWPRRGAAPYGRGLSNREGADRHRGNPFPSSTPLVHCPRAERGYVRRQWLGARPGLCGRRRPG
jgi:hypothetical protein